MNHDPIDSRAAPPAASPPTWERDMLERLAFAGLKESRKARRWGIFFKLLGFAYLTVVLLAAFEWPWSAASAEKHTALVELEGVIQANGSVSADKVTAALQNAFKDKNTQGIVLRINSPGGSPVQAGIIYDEIQRLRKNHPETPLYAVVEDICASGGYYIAAAADKIFVDKASIVGSIGVLMDGFGFTETMQKLGVERRLLTAGDNKGFLDPFSPVNPEQRKTAQAMLNEIHGQFIGVVKQGRGARLKEAPELFSGLVWTGAKSIELGLADEIGTLDRVAREVIKAETVVDFTQKENIAERFAKRFGATLARAFAAGVLGESTRLR